MLNYKINDTSFKVKVVQDKYAYGHNLCLYLQDENGQYLTTITKNLEDFQFDFPNYAFVDINNNPTIEDFIKENKLGKPTGEYGFSNDCAYPLYVFNLKKVKIFS